jgi:hypothetical protein
MNLFLARPAGLEPAAYGFEARRSIQLSYGRQKKNFIYQEFQTMSTNLFLEIP